MTDLDSVCLCIGRLVLCCFFLFFCSYAVITTISFTIGAFLRAFKSYAAALDFWWHRKQFKEWLKQYGQPGIATTILEQEKTKKKANRAWKWLHFPD